jgi:hypothetical protein
MSLPLVEELARRDREAAKRNELIASEKKRTDQSSQHPPNSKDDRSINNSKTRAQITQYSSRMKSEPLLHSSS